MFPCFATGSRVYGEPRHDSDLDIVVLVDRFTLVLLQGMEPCPDRDPAYGDVDADSASLRFGKLNIIATTNPKLFAAWKEGTDKCVREAQNRDTPDLFGKITREEAVEILSGVRKAHGFTCMEPVESEDEVNE